ncbi:hypothetical protein XCR1_1360006 [Xenorhabdus cabanillasii JM26]|uniref:HTH cro/C1-type domain-containing protein n=2 Tax=Xenorhabdus cabanillasii TaxID=351673 RepID=W1IQI7_9GAMM|nr:transcriptional regulator [Xenorhabdus cabanillasii JM26]CDL80098.1 hypothetical protein XCR1_1360006 [Xenorhabdus cabanillasii JM26]
MAIHEIKSVAKLAESLGMNQSTLHRTLSGEVKDPKYSTLKQLADYFGRTPTELMECDLSEYDGDRPYIRSFDDIPESKFQSLPEDVRTAVINAYKEIVAREARFLIVPEAVERQALALEKLAETLVNGFSDLVES